MMGASPGDDEKKEVHELHEITRNYLIFFCVFRVFRGSFSQQSLDLFETFGLDPSGNL